MILVGLILLAVLGRLAVDVAIEPLIELLARLPAEPVEVALLRRAVELLEAGRSVSSERGSEAPASALQIPDRLVGVFEDGRRALFDAIEHLSATTDGLARSAARRSKGSTSVRDRATPAAAEGDGARRRGGLSQLQEAVVALTEALERAAPPIAVGAEAAIGTDVAVRRPQAQPPLADELKQLLQEIGTTP